MDIKDFLDKFMSVDLNTFEWASGPPSKEEYQAYVNKLKAEWLGLSDEELGFSKKHRARYGLIVNGNIVRSSNNTQNLDEYADKEKENNEIMLYDLIDNTLIKYYR